jgi:hypothetical protein
MNEKDFDNLFDDNKDPNFDKKFDDLFGEKLRQEREFIFTEPKWNRMERHLDNFLTLRRWRTLGWSLAASMATLLGVTGWLGWMLTESKRDIATLTQEVHALKSVQTTPSVQTVKTDTIYQKVIIYDTVYQTINRRQMAKDDLSLNSFEPSNSKRATQNSKLPPLSKTIDNQPIVAQKSVLESAKNAPVETIVSKSEATSPITAAAKPVVETAKTTPSVSTASAAENVKKEAVKTETVSKAEIVNLKSEIKDPSVSAVEKIENAKVEPVKTPSTTEITTLEAAKSTDNNTRNQQTEPVKTDTPTKSEIVNPKSETKDPLSKKAENETIESKSIAATETEKADKKDSKKESKKKEKAAKVEKEKISENVDNQLNAAPKPIIKPVQKTGFEIGIMGGRALLDKETDLLKFIDNDAKTIGLRLGYQVNNNWKITGDAQLVGLRFSTDFERVPFDFPRQPPTNDFKFQAFSGRQAFAQYGLGIQYSVGKSRLRPYFGMSVLGQTFFDERYEFRFKKLQTGEEIKIESGRPRGSTRPTLPPKTERDLETSLLLRPQIGLNYRLFGKVSAQVEGSYDIHLGHKRDALQPLWQFKAGLIYKF